MKHLSRLVMLLMAVASPLWAGAKPLSGRHDTLSFATAKQTGKLWLSIRGAYNPTNRAAAGTSPNMGECIDLRMKNNSDSVLYLKLPAGTMLLSQDSSTQDMLVTKTMVYILEPRQKMFRRLYALCGEMHRNAPDIYVNYEVGALADARMVRLAQVIEATKAQNKAGQYAVWALSDQATIKELGEDREILVQSQTLLDMAHINFDIFGNRSTGPAVAQEVAKRADGKPSLPNVQPAGQGGEAEVGTRSLARPNRATHGEPLVDQQAQPGRQTDPRGQVAPAGQEEESTGTFYLLCFGLTVVSAYWLMHKKLGSPRKNGPNHPA
jgi:membrane-bound inhibitor of C-type lysozyme